jgi:hypothetical protein
MKFNVHACCIGFVTVTTSCSTYRSISASSFPHDRIELLLFSKDPVNFLHLFINHVCWSQRIHEPIVNFFPGFLLINIKGNKIHLHTAANTNLQPTEACHHHYTVQDINTKPADASIGNTHIPDAWSAALSGDDLLTDATGQTTATRFCPNLSDTVTNRAIDLAAILYTLSLYLYPGEGQTSSFVDARSWRHRTYPPMDCYALLKKMSMAYL